MTVDIVSVYVASNSVSTAQVPEVINSVYASLSIIGDAGNGLAKAFEPAEPIHRSITPDYLVCREDGEKLKMPKRHKRAAYALSPVEYLARWGLPVDYPVAAPNCAIQLSNFTKQIGLGRKKGEKVGSRKAVE